MCWCSLKLSVRPFTFSTFPFVIFLLMYKFLTILFACFICVKSSLGRVHVYMHDIVYDVLRVTILSFERRLLTLVFYHRSKGWLLISTSYVRLSEVSLYNMVWVIICLSHVHTYCEWVCVCVCGSGVLITLSLVISCVRCLYIGMPLVSRLLLACLSSIFTSTSRLQLSSAWRGRWESESCPWKALCAHS